MESGYWFLILNSHNSHHMINFDNYWKKNNIISRCRLVYLFHILQSFDVGRFRPLKASYNKKMKRMMHTQIMHITENDFFPVFKHPFFAIMDPKNIWSSFKAFSLVPYNPKKQIGGLDFESYTFTPSNFHPMNFVFTNPKKSHTARDIIQYFVNLESKIIMHWSNSLDYLYKLIDMQTKSIFKSTDKMVLLEIENETFCTTNEFFNKWKI